MMHGQKCIKQTKKFSNSKFVCLTSKNIDDDNLIRPLRTSISTA